jgi:NADPH:quinone reductase-like Zn-dependent oxidoreductase
VARQILPIDLPWIPGHEFSGVVEQIGSDVAACAPGDAVFGTTSGMGAYAEYLAVKAAAVARKPSNLSFEEAASVPVAAQTAWQGIFTHGHLEKGQTILIHGGAGAVGAYAVQLASHAGATVIATASGDDEACLNSIGASQVIDYREAQFEKVLREKVDMVFDLIGGDTQKRSFLVLKDGGHLVSATQPVSQEESARHRVSGTMMRLAASAACSAESRYVSDRVNWFLLERLYPNLWRAFLRVNCQSMFTRSRLVFSFQTAASCCSRARVGILLFPRHCLAKRLISISA